MDQSIRDFAKDLAKEIVEKQYVVLHSFHADFRFSSPCDRGPGCCVDHSSNICTCGKPQEDPVHTLTHADVKNRLEKAIESAVILLKASWQ